MRGCAYLGGRLCYFLDAFKDEGKQFREVLFDVTCFFSLPEMQIGRLFLIQKVTKRMIFKSKSLNFRGYLWFIVFYMRCIQSFVRQLGIAVLLCSSFKGRI